MSVPQSLDHAVALRRLDVASAPLILLSAVSIAFAPDVGDGAVGTWIDRFEVALSILFTAEYALRLYLGGRRYAFSFYGVIDLLAGVPGLLILAGGHEMLAIRVLRLFRLLALLKIARFGPATARLGAALHSVRNEFALLAATVGIMLFLAAIGVRHFEAQVQPEHFSTFADCLWWAVVSLTTVGYGDAYPITPAARPSLPSSSSSPSPSSRHRRASSPRRCRRKILATSPAKPARTKRSDPGSGMSSQRSPMITAPAAASSRVASSA